MYFSTATILTLPLFSMAMDTIYVLIFASFYVFGLFQFYRIILLENIYGGLR